MMRLDGFRATMQAFDEITEAMVPESHGYSIGTNVRYAPYQEFGTSYQSGKPHLRPAFDEVVAMHIETIANTENDAETVLKRISLLIERKTKLRAPVDTGNLEGSYRAEPF